MIGTGPFLLYLEFLAMATLVGIGFVLVFCFVLAMVAAGITAVVQKHNDLSWYFEDVGFWFMTLAVLGFGCMLVYSILTL
jgi:hypothetical protein